MYDSQSCKGVARIQPSIWTDLLADVRTDIRTGRQANRHKTDMGEDQWSKMSAAASKRMKTVSEASKWLTSNWAGCTPRHFSKPSLI